MCYICSYCCICLIDKENLHRLSDSEADEINYYIKLTSLIPEMCFKEMNDERLLCKDCCDIIDNIHKFREKCLTSKNKLIRYMSQLHSTVIENKIESEFIKNECDEKSSYKIDGNNFGDDLKSNLETTDENYDYTFINMCETKIETEEEQILDCDKDPNSSTTEKSIKKNKDSTSQQKIIENIVENFDIHEASTSYTTLKEQEGLKIVCNICTKQFSYLYQLKVHMRVHTEEKPFHCTLCPLKFSRQAHLGNHMRKHAEEKSYECILCKTKYTSYENLKQHMLTHSESDIQEKTKKRYECDVCNKNFRNKFHLSDHMRTHTGEKPFECTQCHWKFSRKTHLINHMRRHTGEKPYECHICRVRFTRPENLKRHVQAHPENNEGVNIEETPFECNLCHMKFSFSETLKKHMQTHPEFKFEDELEKKFVCNVCNRKFRHNYHLSDHMRTHTGERPYECDICNKRFRKSSNLKDHKTRHALPDIGHMIPE